MEFSAEHHFDALPEAVAKVLLDRTFYLDLDLPDLSSPEVLEEDVAEGYLQLRYEYVGNLNAMAKGLAGGNRISWTQTLRLDRTTGIGTMHFGAEANPELLRGHARFVLEHHGGGTVRHLEGEVVVAIPVVGRMAERHIVPGVVHRLDIEAEAVAERLAES